MIVEAFIEIPRGSQNKYEYDSARRVFRLDRVFHSPIRCPTEYGFIPGTLAEDGDELDIPTSSGRLNITLRSTRNLRAVWLKKRYL